MTETHILPFVEPATRNPNFQYEIEGVSRKPISISVAIFHFILLRGDRLQFLSSLNGDLIQEELFRSADGIPIDLVRDPTRNISYLYTNGAIFQVRKISFKRLVILIDSNRSSYMRKIAMFGQHSLQKPLPQVTIPYLIWLSSTANQRSERVLLRKREQNFILKSKSSTKLLSITLILD